MVLYELLWFNPHCTVCNYVNFLFYDLYGIGVTNSIKLLVNTIDNGLVLNSLLDNTRHEQLKEIGYMI